MDRRKTLATVGAISLTASAAVVALGSSMGLFGLTNDSPRVGRLSPIDATQPVRTETKTIIVDDPVPTVVGSTSGTGTSPGQSGGRTSGYQSQGDNHASPPPATTVNPPAASAPAPSAPHGAEPVEPHADDSSHESPAPSTGHDDD
jgi:hypothetical protein